jgi:hypothetical protein
MPELFSLGMSLGSFLWHVVDCTRMTPVAATRPIDTKTSIRTMDGLE